MKVYELAKKHQLAPQELIKELEGLKIEVKDYMSVLTPDDVTRYEESRSDKKQKKTTKKTTRKKQDSKKKSPDAVKEEPAESKPDSNSDLLIVAKSTKTPVSSSKQETGKVDESAGEKVESKVVKIKATRSLEKDAVTEKPSTKPKEKVVVKPRRVKVRAKTGTVEKSPTKIEPETKPEQKEVPSVADQPEEVVEQQVQDTVVQAPEEAAIKIDEPEAAAKPAKEKPSEAKPSQKGKKEETEPTAPAEKTQEETKLKEKIRVAAPRDDAAEKKDKPKSPRSAVSSDKKTGDKVSTPLSNPFTKIRQDQDNKQKRERAKRNEARKPGDKTRGGRREDGKKTDAGGGDRNKSGSGKIKVYKSTTQPPIPEPDRTAEKSRGGRTTSKKKDYRNQRKERSEKESNFQYEQKKTKPKQKAQPQVAKSIEIMDNITISDLAKKMNIKASDLIAKLMSMGMMVTINQVIDAETAELVAEEYGTKVNIISLYDETIIEEKEDAPEDLNERHPVVTILGHVDHGKTQLLDAIREANVIDTEAGGITQHIGAYEVQLEKKRITFLDTPGHEAFTAMRARGAQITDIVILVVAADDGVMPQTVEALNHAKAAEVPIIVAINKCDKAEANPERVKQQMTEHELIPEEWGGDVMVFEISALKKTNLDKLLEGILLQAEIMELRANINRTASGTVIESRIDIGRGPVATVLIQNGTLKVGDPFVCGIYSGRVRAMIDCWGKTIEQAGPSSPVEVLGLSGVPDLGDPFQVVNSEKMAKQYSNKRQELKRHEEALGSGDKVTLDTLFDRIKEGEIKDLKLIIKADVLGSAEALGDSLTKLSNDEVRVKIIHQAVGAINESDVNLAATSSAIIIGFHVHPNNKALALADKSNVDIRKYKIIYNAIDDVHKALEGMLTPDSFEVIVGTLEIRDTFKTSKFGTISGCFVTSGTVHRNNMVRVLRDGVEIYDGKIASLKRFKDDVNEVKESFECGITFENFDSVQVGDEIQAYKIEEVAATLKSRAKEE